jgi:hypothetical protein
MTTCNRTAIVVKPDQPFLDWLHRADPTSNELSLEDLQREPTVYLLPECESEEEARKYLGQVCGQIFEEQLDGWYRCLLRGRTGVIWTRSIAGSSGAFTRWLSIYATFP